MTSVGSGRKRAGWLKAAICLMTGVSWLAYAPVVRAASVSPGAVSPAFLEIKKLDCQIIEQECQIFKVNTAFRLENGKSPKGRGLRMAMAQTTNYTLTFVGLLINMIYNFYYYPRGGHATVIAQLAATTPRFIGKAVYLGDLSLEMLLQAIQHRREGLGGFDAGATFRHVSGLRSTLDELLERRERILKGYATAMTPEELKEAELEGKVLKDGRALALDEYAMLYARSRSISTRNKFFNVLTWIKKGDATFGADLTRIIGGATLNRFLSAPASMSTTISGAMSAFDVYAEMSSMKLQNMASFKKVTQALGTKGDSDLATFDADREKLRAASETFDPERLPVLSRVLSTHAQIYTSMGGVVDSMQFVRKKELHHQKMHDLHSIVYHAMYGGSKLSRGSWLIYVGFRYLYGHGHSKHSSLLNGFAGIINFSGAAYREADFLTYDALRIIHRKRNSIKARADAAMVASRWDMLDNMEGDATKSLADLQAAATR